MFWYFGVDCLERKKSFFSDPLYYFFPTRCIIFLSTRSIPQVGTILFLVLFAVLLLIELFCCYFGVDCKEEHFPPDPMYFFSLLPTSSIPQVSTILFLVLFAVLLLFELFCSVILVSIVWKIFFPPTRCIIFFDPFRPK